MSHKGAVLAVCSGVLAIFACSREPAKEAATPSTSVVLRLALGMPQGLTGSSTTASTKVETPAMTAEERARALAEVLQKLKVTTDVPRLVELIGQLGRLDDGSPEVLALCARLLEHEDARVRAAVLEELWFFDDISSLTTNIITRLHDPDCAVRGLAAERLGEIETPLAIEVLIQNLTNDFADVREACKEALLMALAERFDTPEQAYKWWEENRETWFEE